MKPNKRKAVPTEPASAAGERDGREIPERAGWVESIEGDEGSGGAYGHPRKGDEDDGAGLSRENG